MAKKTDKEQIEEFLYHLIPKVKDQTDLISRLREKDFYFISIESFQERYPLFVFHSEYHKHSIMARKITNSLDATEEKYDTRIIFLIKIAQPKTEEVYIYKQGKFAQIMPVPIDKQLRVDHRKRKISMKFPDEMSFAQRSDWRRINVHINNPNTRVILTNPEKEFYHKWKDKIYLRDKNQG